MLGGDPGGDSAAPPHDEGRAVTAVVDRALVAVETALVATQVRPSF